MRRRGRLGFAFLAAAVASVAGCQGAREEPAPPALTAENLAEHVRLERGDSLLFVDAGWVARDGRTDLRVLSARVVPGAVSPWTASGLAEVVVLGEAGDTLAAYAFEPPDLTERGAAGRLMLRLPLPDGATEVRVVDRGRQVEAGAALERGSPR